MTPGFLCASPGSGSQPRGDRVAAIAVSLACGWAGVPAALIIRPGRAAGRLAQARHLAFYLAHVSCGLSQHEAARRFGRHRASIVHGCARIETAREVPSFDCAVSRLEAEVRRACKAFILPFGDMS